MRFLCAVFFFLGVAFAVRADGPIDVSDQKQLFIDQRFIARSENVLLHANPAQKLDRLLDEHGERLSGHISGVLEEQGKVRLYLGADRINIYESDDALHFRDTGKSISGGIFTTLFVDAHDPDPARRYKSFWLRLSSPNDHEKDGVYAAYSADAINFTEVGRVLPYYCDNPILAYWDARLQKYVAFTRALALNNENQRRIARLETDDLLKPWPYTKGEQVSIFLTPENVPVVLAADAQDDPFSDIYYNAYSTYTPAQDVHLMFTSQFRHFTQQRQPFLCPHVPGQWEDFGMLEVQLAVSRDGITWQRPSREPYVATGLADEWDRWYTVMGPGIVRRGNYLYQYYYSSGRSHDGALVRAEYGGTTDLGGIAPVRQRLDGFVSADVDFHGGWLETPTITFSGARLRLNIDTGAMGTAFVELRDADGAAIPGFTLAECEEVGGNYLDQQVYWKSNPDVSALAGKPVRAYLKLNRAKLYAFQFTKN